MTFQSTANSIHWKVHFMSRQQQVYKALATDEGRSGFWAESTIEKNDLVTFNILNYPPYTGKIINKIEPTRFSVEYFGTIADFQLREDDNNSTELSLHATQVPDSIRTEMIAGWVSVLMAMKAYVDHGIDLRNHNEARVWSNGFVDN